MARAATMAAFPLLAALAGLLSSDSTLAAPREDPRPRPRVIAARIAGDTVSIPYVGDLWPCTWADNDRLYLAFGDGTGMNRCLPTLLPNEPDEFDENYVEVSPGLYRVKDPDNEYCEVFGCEDPLPLCPYTPAGLIELRGPVPDFAPCRGPDQCVVSRHLPYGDLRAFEGSDKPSSLIFLRGRLYAAMHFPPGEPERGYVASSDDHGRHWTRIQGSPWTDASPFKVLMWIQMGKAYGLNEDGYLYGLGIRNELSDPPRSQLVYLCRVALPAREGTRDPIVDYDAYAYFTAMEGGDPCWSPDPDAARPLTGLHTMAQGAAMVHEGTGSFLFLSGLVDRNLDGALFAAPRPWGPWREVARLPAGFIPGLVAKGATKTGFYFTAAGGGGVTYNLNIGRIELTLDS